MEARFIPRPLYSERLNKSLDTKNVKVLTGIRRCGKSTLLTMLVNQLLAENYPSENIFYRKFDQFGMPVNPDADWLLNDLFQAYEKAQRGYPFRVFLDEIQEVTHWEKVVRQLHTKEGIDVFITGSNAHVLSSDLATLLAGRHERIEVYPLSFKEYCEFSQALNPSSKNKADLFRRFVTYGGMPGLFDLFEASQDSIQDELNTLFDAIILNDVARRATITDIDLLIKLIRYTYSTSGSLFSTKKIADALTSMGRKVKPETIDNYLFALSQAYALYECPQEGLSGKSILRPLKKLYPADTGLRNMPNGFSGSDIGFQLENVVFIELKRRGYNVFVGALPHAEIDFIAKKGSERLYIQVTTSLIDENVYNRELSPLEAVRDNFPKLILTLDGWREGTTSSGIRIIKLEDWLLA